MASKRSILHKALFLLKIPLLTLFTVVILYFAFAILFSFLPTHPPDKNCLPEKNIFLNTNGVHVDLIIPIDQLDSSFRKQLGVMPATQYVAFGWGDRNFYLKTPEWSDLTFTVAFKALFLKSSTAMHVTFYSRKVDSWKQLPLCDEQLLTLIDYINNSFAEDENGKLVKIDFEGYHQYDSFFEAKGSFSLFKTCNVWVNRALKKAEVRTAVWTPFDFGVLYHIK